MHLHAHRAAPNPADLIHLRPTDGAAIRVVLLAFVGTAAGVALTLSDGWLVWAAGQLRLAVMLVQ